MRTDVRIVIPRKIDIFLRLAKEIEKKYDDTLTDNPLQHFAMAKFKEKMEIAKLNHDKAEDLSREKPLYYQNRNIALGISPGQDSKTKGTILFFLTSIKVYLLGIYKGQEQMMGDWGYVINSSPKGKVRVVLGRNADNLLILAKSILDKHEIDGTLSILNQFDMATMSAVYLIAKTEDDKAKITTKNKEKYYQLRDIALGFRRGDRKLKPDTLLFYITCIRDILVGHFKGEERYLGEWGFEVNDTKRKKKELLEVNEQ